MYFIINERFNKNDESMMRIFKCEMNNDLNLFKELVNSKLANDIYMKKLPYEKQQLFFDKTDELLLMNHSTKSLYRNIYESILFKMFILIPHTLPATNIAIRLLPKVEKLEIFIKCCMECYFNDSEIQTNSTTHDNEPFLSSIYYVLTYLLSYYKYTANAIEKSYQLCINMIKENKQAVISYYSEYQTDYHFQNSKDLLEEILKLFTTDLYKVYNQQLRIVLNSVMCFLMDKGKKEEMDYISLFNLHFKRSMFMAFENRRIQYRADPFIYKYISTFSHYKLDILAECKCPQSLQEVINELYPKLALRNLIFVDSNQKHRTFIPISVIDFKSVEELSREELEKKFKSFLQFSLYPQRAYFTDVIIVYKL